MKYASSLGCFLSLWSSLHLLPLARSGPGWLQPWNSISISLTPPSGHLTPSPLQQDPGPAYCLFLPLLFCSLPPWRLSSLLFWGRLALWLYVSNRKSSLSEQCSFHWATIPLSCSPPPAASYLCYIWVFFSATKVLGIFMVLCAYSDFSFLSWGLHGWSGAF